MSWCMRRWDRNCGICVTVVRLTKIPSICLTKVSFVHRAKVQYLCLELYSSQTDLGHQISGMSSMFFSSYCTNCHVHALFINGHRLATNSHVHDRDIVVPHFLCQYGELSLGVLQVTQARPPPLTCGRPGQTQFCSFVNMLRLINFQYTLCFCVRLCMCTANLTSDGL